MNSKVPTPIDPTIQRPRTLPPDPPFPHETAEQYVARTGAKLLPAKTRWACRGDTIQTVTPLQSWPNEGAYLSVTLETPKSCAYANYLIEVGRWEVITCGKCGPIEDCTCGAEGQP